MDFTVSYHPITTEQMKEWYFDVFNDIGAAAELKVRIPKEQLKHDDLAELETYYKGKYLDMVKHSRNLEYDHFNNWHGYFLAVVQGFFEKFYLWLPHVCRTQKAMNKHKRKSFPCIIHKYILHNYY